MRNSQSILTIVFKNSKINKLLKILSLNVDLSIYFNNKLIKTEKYGKGYILKTYYK